MRKIIFGLTAFMSLSLTTSYIASAQDSDIDPDLLVADVDGQPDADAEGDDNGQSDDEEPYDSGYFLAACSEGSFDFVSDVLFLCHKVPGAGAVGIHIRGLFEER